MKYKTAANSAIAERQVASNPDDAAALAAAPVVKRILVSIDFSDGSMNALEYALMLAGALQATLILLHVVEPACYGTAYLAFQNGEDDGAEGPLDSARKRLIEIERKRIGSRVPCETLVRLGRAWSEIPDTAQALGADLIVLGARAHKTQPSVPVGSTAEGVLRHAHCPVLTVTYPGK